MVKNQIIHDHKELESAIKSDTKPLPLIVLISWKTDLISNTLYAFILTTDDFVSVVFSL